MKRKNPLKLKACIVALSLWGLSAAFALSSSPIMAADTASNTAQEQVAIALFNKGFDLGGLRYEETFYAYNDLITRFNNSHDQDIQEDVTKARYPRLVLKRILPIKGWINRAYCRLKGFIMKKEYEKLACMSDKNVGGWWSMIP